jgi:hypothetical protein
LAVSYVSAYQADLNTSVAHKKSVSGMSIGAPTPNSPNKPNNIMMMTITPTKYSHKCDFMQLLRRHKIEPMSLRQEQASSNKYQI